MQTADPGAPPGIEAVRLDGKIVMVGCGSIGQAALPLLPRHIDATGGIVVLAADERGRGIAAAEGARFLHCHLKPGSYERELRAAIELRKRMVGLDGSDGHKTGREPGRQQANGVSHPDLH